MKISSLSKERCTGCQLCSDVCNEGAISFITDTDGFWYPKIDKEKCTDCGRCFVACPSCNDTSARMVSDTQSAYEGWNNDDVFRLNSTSGGIFYSIAENVLENNGYVGACSYTDGFCGAKHEIGNDRSILSRVQGSKYFQSDCEGIYRKVKALLKDGKTVLFCGTPCQNAALLSFISDEERTRLIACDFVCRGINSPLAYRSFLSMLEKRYKSKVQFVQFKNKYFGWDGLGTRVDFQNGKSYIRDRFSDAWINGYIVGNLYSRLSCFRCQYMTIKRVSDITLGDYWGTKADICERFKGVSLMLANTMKGRMIINDLSREKKISIATREISEIVSGNMCLCRNEIPEGKRKEFFMRINDDNFEKLVFQLLGISALARLKRRISGWLKHQKRFISTPNITLFRRLMQKYKNSHC